MSVFGLRRNTATIATLDLRLYRGTSTSLMTIKVP